MARKLGLSTQSGLVAIVPRMGSFAAIREAEPWSTLNVLGGLLLLAALIWFLVWAIRRYLED